MGGSLVLLSGGQDSTTALYATLANPATDRVAALAFHYGQEHANETHAAYAIARDAGVDYECCPIPRLRLGDDADPVVPVRNMVLLSLAANRAVDMGFDELVVGCCADDAELFPDCRPDFLDAYEQVLACSGVDLRLEAPLVELDKAAIFGLASELGILDLVVSCTRTCYRGNMTRHDWGYGCGECLACTTRARGWREFTAA